MEWDTSYNIKQDYEICLREATEDMYKELGRVAAVDSSEKKRMSDLVKRAANLWLEASQQRCRIFLRMSYSADEPVRSTNAALDSDGTMELVVVPEVRRLGNAQGERLEKDELVAGCQGRFSIFSTS